MFYFVPKTSLLPVKKKTFYIILHNVMYHFINCSVFIDIKQSLANLVKLVNFGLKK